MNPKQCEKCGEMVEAAKAFCPGCGSPMVAEAERTRVSEFDASAGTVQYGKTVFGNLLSDMGLNISDVRNSPAKPADAPPPEPVQKAAETEQTTKAGTSRSTKWVIAGIIILLLVMAVVFAAAALFVFFRWEQT
jgi:hypothetical protein